MNLFISFTGAENLHLQTKVQLERINWNNNKMKYICFFDHLLFLIKILGLYQIFIIIIQTTLRKLK